MSFQQLQLIAPLLQALQKEGYVQPTPIQQAAIPPILENRDLLGCAQTGTGKTAAFTLPILQLLFRHRQQQPDAPRHIQALILTPTRELAIQIDDSIRSYGRYLPLKHTVIFGGVNQRSQVQALRAGVDILVDTPGRLLDLLQQRILTLAHIRFFVLDEADRMLDMGFIQEVRRIIEQLPARRQTLFFSATMPPEIQQLSHMLLSNPVKVEVTPQSSTVELIDQKLYFTEKHNKRALLLHLLQDSSMKRVLVFTQMKHAADRLAQQLNKAGVPAVALHGNKTQGARQKALEQFRQYKTRVLVATDIAARGIDIDDLTHVINYELPPSPETYVHRIGRTGRAGAAGTALSFCDWSEKAYLNDIQKLIKKTIPVVTGHPFDNAAMHSKPPVVAASPAAHNFGTAPRGRRPGRVFRQR